MAFIKSLFLYTPKDTPIHKLHPAVKCLLLIVFSLVPLIVDDPLWQIPFLASAVIFCFIAKVSIGNIKLYLLGILWMCLVSIAVNTFFGERKFTLLFQYGWVTVYQENLLFGVSVGFKLAIMAIMTALFLSVTSLREIGVGFRSLKLPYLLSFILSLSLRSLQIFATDWLVISEAIASRGLDFKKGGLMEKAKKYGSLLMPMMVISVRRTTAITNALNLRAFDVGRMKRTYYFQPAMRTSDRIAAFLLVFLVVVVGFLRYALNLFTL